MSPKHFIVATAGHVDHGKSALVKALTGTDPDRLPEEKARGITIDLGFAHLQLRSPNDQTELDIGIVDVPGHEDLVKNMVAGVGAIDLALLMVAADDGWMPQTEEHLQILEYVGIGAGIVVLTKVDRLDPSKEPLATAAVRARLHRSPLADAPIIPVSAVTGRGVEELKQTIATTLARSCPPDDIGKPRLWIDRVFTLHGVGRVVTGTLTGGTLGTDDALAASSGGPTFRIRSLQSHNRTQAAVFPGMRVAINLTAVDPHGDVTAVLHRGTLLTTPELHLAGDTYNVWLARSGRMEPPVRFLGHDMTARLHVGTAAVGCRIILPDRPRLEAGEAGIAQLRLDRPLPLVGGDRFVLRDMGGRATLGGGTVLEAAASRERFRRAEHQAFLHSLSSTMADPVAFVRAHLARDGVVSLPALVAAAPFAREQIEAAVEKLVSGSHAVVRDTVAVGSGVWDELIAAAASDVESHHANHPTQNGMPLVQLRTSLRRRTRVAAAANLIVRELTENNYELVGAAIRRRGFRPTLPAHLRGAVERVAAMLARAGLNPPARKEITPSAILVEALEFLIKTGQAVALGPDVVLATMAFNRAVRAISAHLARQEADTVSNLKQLLGTSRRVMVPLLERLDHDGITFRDGEYRRLRSRQPMSASCRSELARD